MPDLHVGFGLDSPGEPSPGPLELEQEILDEVDEINDEWERKAAEIEAAPIRLESDDLRVVETALLWIPGP